VLFRSKAGDDIGKRTAFIQDAYSKGLFDDEDLELFSSERPDKIDAMLVDKLRAEGYEELLPEQYRGASNNEPSSVRETQWFMNQSDEVKEAHLKLKRGLQLTPEEKLAHARAMADIKAAGKGKETSAVIEAETNASDLVADAEANKAKTVQLQKDAAAAAKSAQGTYTTLRNANRIYDQAIAAIDKGAESGAFAKQLPTFRAQTLELQNAIRKAGLNTISGVTLGAISKPELELALAVDIPEGMDEDDLKPYLQKKKKANIKLMKELNKMSSFLSKKGNTVAMWNEKWGGDTDLLEAVEESSPQAEVINWSDL
jgi:hypothetical protein